MRYRLVFTLLVIFTAGIIVPDDFKKAGKMTIANIIENGSTNEIFEETINLKKTKTKELRSEKEIVDKKISIQIGDIIISEINSDPEGNDEGKEFIKLFNKSLEDVDIRNWRIKLNDKPLLKIGGSKNDQTIIRKGSSMLIGLNKRYEGASITRSVSLPNRKGTIMLYNESNILFDAKTY